MAKKPNAAREKIYQNTKVLYRNSNNTLGTASKTVSDYSQIITRRDLAKLKKELAKTTICISKDGKQQDLSLDTDHCILRRYYINKRNELDREAIASESKYSNRNQTRSDLCADIHQDCIACGDNIENMSGDLERHINFDVQELLVENLKLLLTKFMKKMLVENKDNAKVMHTTVKKIVRDMKQDNKKQILSSSTFTLNDDSSSPRECRNNIRHFNSKCSYYTIPYCCRKFKFTSTLSIPRKLHHRNKYKEQLKKNLNKFQYISRKKIPKDLLLSIKKSSKFIVDSSGCNILEIIQGHESKRMIANSRRQKTRKKKQYALKKKQGKDKNANQTIQSDNLDAMPSLVKSIFADDPANVTSTERNFNTKQQRDNFTITDLTMTKQVSKLTVIRSIISTELRPSLDLQRQVVVTAKDLETQCNLFNCIDTENIMQSINFIDECKQNRHTISQQSITVIEKDASKDSTDPKIRESMKKRKSKKYELDSMKKTKLRKLRKRKCNFHPQKSKSSQMHRAELWKHLQSIISYFTEDNDRNIKCDVQINIYPTVKPDNVIKKDDSTNLIHTHRTTVFNVEQTTSPFHTFTEDLKASIHQKPEIISLLDGSVSHERYILCFDDLETPPNSVERNLDEKHLQEKSTTTDELEIVQEISELKSIIKDLTAAAEKFLNEHVSYLKEDNNNCGNAGEEKISINQIVDSDTVPITETDALKKTNPSKGIQLSKIGTRSLLSGLKLHINPKRKEEPKTNCASYDIIESESIIRVTDMTSAANYPVTAAFANVDINCNLPKSRSLFEIVHGRNPEYVVMATQVSNKYVDGNFDKTKDTDCLNETKINNTQCYNFLLPELQLAGPRSPMNKYDDNKSRSSIVIEIENNPCYASRADKQLGMSFWAGCFYCLLFWIPIIILSVLLILKLKESPDSNNALRDMKITTPQTSLLSDLGF